MNLYHEVEILDNAYDSRLLGRLLTYLWHYWFQVVMIIFILLVVTGRELIGPDIIKMVINPNIVPNITRGLFGLTMIYFGILIVQFIFRFA